MFAAKGIELADVIRWYQPFINVKLCRAIQSRACEQLVINKKIKQFPKHSDGSARIALIAMDRSIAPGRDYAKL